MRPIPLCLLIHSAMLSDVERDEYGNEQDKAAACLQNVRFEPSTRMPPERISRQAPPC